MPSTQQYRTLITLLRASVNYESSIALPGMLIDHQSYFAKYYILINYILEKTFFLPFLHHNRVKIIKI